MVLANPAFVDAYLKHVAFWMDKGIAGWDVDAPSTWRNLNVGALRAITRAVKERGGFATSENWALDHDMIRQGRFNAGTGVHRTQLYSELAAMLDGDADYIRRGMARRRQLIEFGIFPFQQFADEMYEQYSGKNHPWKLQMFRLQVAFNAALPDQVWAFANAIAFPTKPLQPLPSLDCVCWGQLDLTEIERQKADPHSVWFLQAYDGAAGAREGVGDRRAAGAAHRPPQAGVCRAARRSGLRRGC